MLTPEEFEALAPRWFTLRPHPLQRAYLTTPARFIALPCGRRSGKTELSKRRLIRHLMVDRGHGQIHQYRAAAPTIGQARDLFWEDLKSLIADLAKITGYVDREGRFIRTWYYDFNESRLEIDSICNGVRAKLKCIGCEKAQRAEGQGIDGIVLDESSDIRPGIFARTFMPALADRAGWAVRQGVPKRFGVGGREYREFCEKGFSGKDPMHVAFTWPSWEILPPEEIAIQREQLSADDFNEQFGAAWLSIGGVAFWSFDADLHIHKCKYDPQKPILMGTDFNVSPMAWCCCQEHDGILHCFDEFFISNTNTLKTLDALYDRYSTHTGGWFFYGDATSKSNHSSASASDYAHIVNDKRFRARPDFPAANPGRKDRLASCNTKLRNAAGTVGCWIDPKCQHLIADLRERGLDDDGCPAEGKSGEAIGHMSDAWGYLIHRKWPSTIIAPAPARSFVGTL